MPYADRMHKALIGRTGDWLARRSRPWLVMLIAFACAVLAAYEASSALVGLGLHGMASRFAVAFVAAYAAFLLVLGVWFVFSPTIDAQALLEGAPLVIETQSPGDDDIRWGEHVRQTTRQIDFQDGAKAVVGFLLIAAILGALFVMFHWIRFARWYLGEILVLGGKIWHRALGARTSGVGLLAPAAQTVWIALTLLAHYALIGLVLQLMFPGAVNLADVFALAR